MQGKWWSIEKFLQGKWWSIAR